MNKIITFCFLLSAPLVLASCAKQGFPPGGPVDKTPPEVVATFPAGDSTGVSPGVRIEISFNERMDRNSAQEAVYVSPVPERRPEYGWRGRTLLIKPPEELRLDQTYVVTVGTGAKDVQGNPLASAYTFAFSTGSRIDSGKISAGVITSAGPQPGAFAWAYRLNTGKEPNPAEDTPDYTTQTDKDGTCVFSHIASGIYRVFAFVDKDGDGKYTPEREALAVPPLDADVADSASFAQIGDLFPVVRDTTRPQLLRISAPDQNHLELTFDEPVDLTFLEAGILGQDTLLVLAKYVVPGQESRVCLLTERQRPERYSVVLDNLCDLSGNAALPESLFFRGSPTADTVPPKVAAVSPQNGATNVSLDQAIEIVFSEAMNESVAEGSLQFPEPYPAGSFLWSDPITLQYRPSKPWNSMHRYCFNLVLPLVTDYLENAPSDSLFGSCFTTVNKDTLGFITGEVDAEVLGSGAEIFVCLSKDDGAAEYRVEVPGGGEYLTEGVLPGSYFVWAFWDKNGDGEQDYGRAFPYQPAEPATSFAGTVWVRSRWTSEKVDLKF